jgi:hypothetical protein
MDVLPIIAILLALPGAIRNVVDLIDYWKRR